MTRASAGSGDLVSRRWLVDAGMCISLAELLDLAEGRMVRVANLMVAGKLEGRKSLGKRRYVALRLVSSWRL